jgi:dihydroneopterin aldolase
MTEARDKIILEGMTFYGYHGVSDAERELGQRFVVDLETHTDTTAAGLSDQLRDSVNYTHLYQAVREVVEGPPHRLLEAVAEAIATRILGSFDVEAVRVRVSKPHVPIRGGVIDSAAVEIFREK